MAFCTKCGAQTDQEASFCPVCGAAIAQPQAVPPQQAAQPQATQSQLQPQNTQQNIGNDSNDKVMAILAYFIFFIPLIAAPKSRFARYHANQGLILMIICVALSIINLILRIAVSWRGWAALSILFTFVYLAVLVMGIFGIVYAAQKREKPMPVIGSLFTIIK